MKGHIRERSPGHWAIVLDVRDPATGKRKRKWHSFQGTKRQAQTESARLISELQGGGYMEPTKMTFVQFLDQWLGHIKAQVSPRTHERYTEIVKKNIGPVLGAVHLSKLRPTQIASAYSKALLEGRRDGSGGLSPNTVLYMHRLIKQALAHAVRWEIISRSPADVVDPPKIERITMITYDMTQTAELLEVARGTRLLVPVILGILCGLRRGEIVALRWRQVDLANAQLAVVASAEQTREGVRYKQPKTGRARTVALSPIVVPINCGRPKNYFASASARMTLLSCMRARMEGRSSRVASRTLGIKCSPKRHCPESGFMICGTPMPPTFSQAAFTQRSQASAWVTPRWGSRSTSTRMSSPACRPMPPPALTKPFEWRYRSGLVERWVAIR